MTSLKAVCGCKWILQSNAVITPTEVLRSAQVHSTEANHTIILQGVIIRPRAKEWSQPIQHDNQRK